MTQQNNEIKILKEGDNPFEPGYINLLSPWENPLDSDQFNFDVREKLYRDIIKFSKKDNNANSEYRFIVGEKGEGKTHVLCNIRDRLIQSGKSVFIYVEPKTLESYNDKDSRHHIYFHILNQIENSILAELGGMQGDIFIATILNNYFLPYIKDKYDISIPKIKYKEISKFQRILKKRLATNKKQGKKSDSLGSIFMGVKNKYLRDKDSEIDYDAIHYIFSFAFFNNNKDNYPPTP